MSASGKGAPPPKAAGKGAGKNAGKTLTYKERREAELSNMEDRLSAEQGFSGKELTAEEAAVINDKGTEEQGTGEYEQFQPRRGYFACRKCGSPIYSHEAKFQSGCGWPAFDQCYAGSIITRPETDGTDRTEITCARCSGHLGHVFVEPNLPAKARSDQRHCSNSLALQYVKHEPPEGTLGEVTLELTAGGSTTGPGDAAAPGGAAAAPDGAAATPPGAAEDTASAGATELQITLLLETQGDGTAMPGAGDLVAIHYTGTLLSSGVEFDTSRDGDPFEFRVDCGHVIQGWDDGVKRMPLGSRAVLIVPAALGYGARGMPGAIPPHADLLFELELVSINGKQAPKDCSPQRPTQAGFLHQSLTPALRPAMLSLLRERPTEPCKHLLRCLQPGVDAAEPAPGSGQSAAGDAREYAALLRPLLEEMSLTVLDCLGRQDQALPRLAAWLHENAARTLGPATPPEGAG